jgi:hypothetical protein
MAELMRLAESAHSGPDVIDGAFIEHAAQPVPPDQLLVAADDGSAQGNGKPHGQADSE